MNSFIYVKNKLDLPELEKALGVEFNNDFRNYNLISNSVWYQPHCLHNRFGKSKFWNLELLPEHRIPILDPNFNLSFEEVTDRRALELERLVESSNRPLVINWSGGIDSTCAVSAIYKNFKPHNRQNVTVSMNNYSYFENPVFFNKIIKPNFKIDRIENQQYDPWTHSILVSGEPADEMWIHADIIEIAHRYPGSSRNSIRSNPDHLIEFIGHKSNPEHAKWFYEMVLEESANFPIPIETYEDFYWWVNFNFYLVGDAVKEYLNGSTVQNQEMFELFRQYYKPWYLTDDYQCWSMMNNSNGVKIDDTIRSYKYPSKKYIFDVDKNPYYLNYKTKTASVKMYTTNRRGNTLRSSFAIKSNGEVVSFGSDEFLSMLKNNREILK
jgi:hypothetical protein